MQSDSVRMGCGAAHPVEEGEGTVLFCASRQVHGTGNLLELGSGGCDRRPGQEIKGVAGKRVRARPFDGYLLGGAGARPFAAGVRCAFSMRIRWRDQLSSVSCGQAASCTSDRLRGGRFPLKKSQKMLLLLPHPYMAVWIVRMPCATHACAVF